MKRFFASVLITAFVLSACSTNNSKTSPSTSAGTTSPTEAQTATATEENSYVNPPGVYPITKEPITLRIFAENNGTIIENLETNEFTKWYEELTNVHIQWDIVQAKSEEKVPLILASGDLPDVFMATNKFSDAQLVDYASQGLLLPLNEHIDKYGPNIKKVLDEYPIAADYSYTPDGNIYALNRIVDSFNESMPKRAWVYQPWLDKLNMKMPTTTDEFYDMLVAFRDKDPNGNGLKDEVAFAGSDKSANGEIDSFILNSFMYYDRDRYGLELLPDGKIRSNINSEEYREGLRFLNKLVKEGLLDPATYTQDRNALKALTEGGDVNLLGAVTAFYWGHFTNENGAKGRDLEFTAIPVLKGPNGVQNAFDRGTLVNAQRFEITKANKYPEATIRWADYFFDPDGMMDKGFSVNAGKEGVGWKRADGTVLGIDGKPAKYEYIIAPGIIQNNYWFQLPPYFESADYINSWAANLPSSRKEVFGSSESAEKYAPYSALNKRVPFTFTPQEYLQEFTDINLNMKDTVEKYRVGFILGDYNLDTDWDTYLKDLKTAGLERYVELNQIKYDARK